MTSSPSPKAATCSARWDERASSPLRPARADAGSFTCARSLSVVSCRTNAAASTTARPSSSTREASTRSPPFARPARGGCREGHPSPAPALRGGCRPPPPSPPVGRALASCCRNDGGPNPLPSLTVPSFNIEPCVRWSRVRLYRQQLAVATSVVTAALCTQYFFSELSFDVMKQRKADTHMTHRSRAHRHPAHPPPPRAPHPSREKGE